MSSWAKEYDWPWCLLSAEWFEPRNNALITAWEEIPYDNNYPICEFINDHNYLRPQREATWEPNEEFVRNMGTD